MTLLAGGLWSPAPTAKELENNMAWNPSPKVADCREIARKWGVDEVIILAVNKRNETLVFPKSCRVAGRKENWKTLLPNYKEVWRFIARWHIRRMDMVTAVTQSIQEADLKAKLFDAECQKIGCEYAIEVLRQNMGLGEGTDVRECLLKYERVSAKLATALNTLKQIADSKRGGLNKRLAHSVLEFIECCDDEQRKNSNESFPRMPA